MGGSVVDEEAFSRDGHDPISILSNRVLPPDFVSDEPISAIFVRAEAGTPFDFARFEAEDDLSRLDGTAHLEGTNESDTFVLTDAGSLSVGGGDDVVEMNTGTFVNGGAGYDTIIVANVDFVIGGVGDDTVASDGGRTVWGGDGNDILSGTADMWAGSGDDILSGSGAMYGGDGNDTLIGSGRMIGEGGDDVLIALQNTTLRGDSSSLAGLEPSGADTFIVSIQGLSVDAPGTPVELATILDFDAEHDQLVVLTRDGVEPASMSFADGILRLNFENGATGLVTLPSVESLDVSIVTFADEDTVLGALPSGYPTT